MKPTKTLNLGEAIVRQRVRFPINGLEADIMTFHGLIDRREHIALGLGDWENNPAPLVRMHSECLTGDVFLSGRCDCGEQLHEAILKTHQVGGIILYLRQEGRGIGLYNKIDAYALQLQGKNTYEANRLLGLKDDLRDYTVAKQMLEALRIKRIQLLSNNPDKVQQLFDLGIEVTNQIATGIYLKKSNRAYLEAKISVTHHTMHLAELTCGVAHG